MPVLSRLPYLEEVARGQGAHRLGGLGEGRLRWLGDRVVALPALVLQLQGLYGVGVGVESGQGLVLRDPATVDLVGDRQLPGLVEEVDNYVLAEVLERDLRAE